MSLIVRLVYCLIILLIAGNVLAQESQSIRATAHVINNEVVKTWAEASPLNINGTEIYEVTVLKQGNGDIQLNITEANGKTEEQTIKSDNGYLYHKALIEAGRNARKEESAVPDTSSTLVTIIYLDI